MNYNMHFSMQNFISFQKEKKHKFKIGERGRRAFQYVAIDIDKIITCNCFRKQKEIFS